MGMRILPLLVLLSALAIAGCSAFFSIVGLKLLFVGGGISIVVMGIALEVGKLITATFLKQHWATISVAMRTYMMAATLLLVAITSIGIYGYLSAGYNATSVTVQGYERQIAFNTTKIDELEKEITYLKSDTYNEAEVASLDSNRKTVVEQRLALIAQKNQQLETMRHATNTDDTSSEDIAAAKKALDLAKSALDSDTDKELEQIKLYNNRLGILDQEVQKWLDEGRGSIFRKGGLDKARETKEQQKSERDDIDAQIKKSQDRIDHLRSQYAERVKEYNDRVATIETRSNVKKSGANDNIKSVEKEISDLEASIVAYNKEVDAKIVSMNAAKGDMAEQNKAKVVEIQSTIQVLHDQNDGFKSNVVKTDVGTFKFIAKSLNIPLDNAVNYFIWMIMVVFDPLAVVLILAYNSMVGKKIPIEEKLPKVTKKLPVEPPVVDNITKTLEPTLHVNTPTPVAPTPTPIAPETLVLPTPIPEIIEIPLAMEPPSEPSPTLPITKSIEKSNTIRGEIVFPTSEHTGTLSASLNE